MAECKDYIPCSKWVKFKKTTATCDEFCASDEGKNKKCVSSWISETPNNADFRCETLSPSTCEATYSVDTAVVCVCAVKAKCTLYAKCDFPYKDDKAFRPSGSKMCVFVCVRVCVFVCVCVCVIVCEWVSE